MGNEVWVIVGLLIVGAIIGILMLRRISTSPVTSDHDETTTPTLHEQRQLEDGMMHDGLGLHHRYPRH